MSGGDVPVELLHACKDKLTLEGNYEAHAHGGGVYADSVANVTDSEMAGNVISITGDHITLGKADRQARYHYSVEPEWPKGTLTSHVQYTVRAGGGGLSAKDALNTLRESNILENTVTLKNSNLLGGSINSAFDPVNDSPLSYDYDKDEFIYKKNYYFYPEIMGNLEFDVLLAGGGVEAGSIAAIKDVKVIGNKLAMSGGSLAGGTFNSNVASSDNKIKLYLDHETRTSVDVDGLGGGIYGEGAIQQVSDLTLTNNKINLTGPEVKSTVTSMNGEIKGDGSSVFYNSDSQTVVSLTAGGGGLHAARIGNISGLNAEANSAQAVGGKITASYFSGNVRLNSNNDAHEGDYSDFQVNSDSSVINRTYARGGAVNSSVSLAGISSDSSFTNNEAKASSGIITGVAGKNDLVLKGDIDFLTVGAKDKSIRAEVHNNVTAAGGAIAASALGQVSGVFTDNMAIAESGAITGQEINVTYELTKKESSGITIASTDIVNAVLAKGGAISADGQIDVISGATFTDNSAQASTGDITGGKNAIKVTGNNKEASGYSLTVSAGITSSARAEGGAVHTASLELIKDSAFTGNKAAITAVGNIAKGNNDSSSVSGFRDENYSEKTFFTRPTYEARGGAVSVSNFTTMRIENSIFEGNSAQAAFDYGLAKGGALYLDVGATAGFKVLTLAADAGKKLIFRDNFQHDNQDTKEIPNDIYFGSEKGGHSNSVYVDIVGQGDVQILGGVQAGPKAAEELFIRTTGNLYLAGVNSADRLTVYTYNGGKLNLQTGVVFENPDTTSIVVTDKGELIVDDSFTPAAGKTLALSVGEVRVEAKGRLVINDGYSLNISGVKTGLFRDAALDVGLSNVTALRVGGRPFVFNGSNTINIQDASYITDTMQTYTIIDGLQQGGYYSFDSVTIENKALEALRYDVLQSYEYNAGKLLLAVKQGTNQNVFFTGSGKAKWNETDLNWKNSVNNSKIFINHDNVIFNSGAAGVAVDAGGVTVSGMLVADGVFSFSGGDIKGVTTGHTGSITASGKLMLTGGQADFYNRLDFSNGIFIDDGTLSLKQSGTIAAGNAVTVNSDGIFALESTSSKNFANTVTGSGNLDKTGSGVLNINGGLSGFTGALSVLDGSMILNGADIAAVRSLAVAAGKRLELNNIGTLSARLSGSGAIDKTGANTLSISERAFDGFTGAFSVKDGKVDIKGNQILSASLDTGGKELTFNPASGEFQRFAGGSVAGSGTVLKTGDGALFFTNNALSGFNGTVDHQQGVMEISGNLGASIESQTGSSLWLIGQTKTIGGDATLRGQVYTHGALTIKGKALLDGTLNITSLHKDITTLKAKDSATLSDTSTINLLEFSEGKYELISSDTSLVGSLAAPGITVGNRDISGNPRYSVNVKQEGKALVAELSSSDNEYLLWQGQSSSDWNGYNWVVQGGNDAISYIFNDYVSFDNTAGGRNVALNGAMAAVYGMTVDGNNYVFSNGVIEGTANKKGDNLRAVDHKRGLHLKSGRTTFSNTGIYFSQGLNIENGAAAVFTGASYLHKTGDSSLATAIRNNGVLELDLTSGYEFSNTMSGSGNFVKKGAAKLFLLGDISGFSGLMSVENGAIVSQSSNDFNPAMRIDLAAAGELALNSNVRSVLANRLTGAGKLTKLRSAELTV
ncbi:hypothetical protein LJB82_04075, partial [Desulfovibrio sp. OttesenSCG-928-M16]|nr:hypothetical protein [Desulfovibrio sp. OttesenSCG-928-M16]